MGNQVQKIGGYTDTASTTADFVMLITNGILAGLKYHNRSVRGSSFNQETQKLQANRPSLKGCCSFDMYPGKQQVTFQVQKIVHYYKSTSGTLRLQLCKNDWPYKSSSDYKKYDLLAEYRLGQLQQGYVFNNIKKTVNLKTDGKDSNTKITMFLQEYDNGGWKVRDYRDFQKINFY